MGAVNFLTDEELAELTGFKWHSRQQMALAQMGVKFRVNARGRILVSRSVIDGGKPKRKATPDWSAMDDKAA